MTGRAWTLLALLATAAVAGCLDGPRADSGDAIAATLQPDTRVLAVDLPVGAYHWLHDDALGAPHLTGNSTQAYVDAGDHRLWSGPVNGSVALPPLPAGTPHAYLTIDNGTLDLSDGDGHPIWVQPVPLHRQRVVLVEQTGGQELDPLGAGLFAAPVDVRHTITVEGVPTSMQALVHGEASALRVDVVADGRLIYAGEVDQVGRGPLGVAQSQRFFPLPAALDLRGLAGGPLQVHVTAASLQGVVVLDVASPSAARPQHIGGAWPGQHGIWHHVAADLERHEPIAFQVPDHAEHILVGDAYGFNIDLEDYGVPSSATIDLDIGPGVVALYAPDDDYLGIVVHDGINTTAVPSVGGGEYVAVLLSGEAVVGADAIPADFTVRRLDTVTAAFPRFAAGNTPSGYGHQNATLHRSDVAPPAGRPFDVTLGYAFEYDATRPPILVACHASTVRVGLGNHTITAAGDHWLEGPWADAAHLLGQGPWTVFSDGFGAEDSCHRVAAFTSYVR